MSAWHWIALGLIALAVLLVLVPIRVRVSFQGRGEPNGFWALAGGAQLGPISGSALAARGVPAALGLHLGKRKIWSKPVRELLHKRKREQEPEEELGARERVERVIGLVEKRYAQVERWVDPVELVWFVVHERRRIEIEQLVIDLDYDFADIALTGKLLGAIYALSPLLPAAVVIRQHPGWQFEDRASFAGAGKIRIWPGLLIVEAAWFVIRKGRVRRPRGAARGAVKVS